MTNYEWLVKQDLLSKFLEDFNDDMISVEDMDSRYGHIYQAPDKSYFGDVAAWLQEERKFEEYVRLDDVINIISNIAAPNVPQSIHFFSKYCADLIRGLPTKIMDKEVENG